MSIQKRGEFKETWITKGEMWPWTMKNHWFIYISKVK